MKFQSLASVVFVFAGLVSGCAPDSTPKATNVAKYWREVIEFNASALNGINLNGLNQNGINLNGLNLNGINLNGINLNGINLNGTAIEGVDTVSTLTKSGEGLEGYSFTGTLSNSTTVDIYVADVVPPPTSNPADPLHDITLYKLYFQNGTTCTGDDCPVCGYDYDENEALVPVLALPLSGTWDSTGAHASSESLFTFACVNTALGKCALWGYKPWAAVEECSAPMTCSQKSLAPMHQACTRMVRADYCGNGIAHTRNHTPINIWDNFGESFGLQTRDTSHNSDPDWSFEAEWTPNGARCLERTRWENALGGPLDSDYDYVADVMTNPSCAGVLAENDMSCMSSTDEDFHTAASGSTFFTANGYNTTPLSARKYLRNDTGLNEDQ